MSVALIELTLGEIARRLGAPLEGDALRIVRTIAPLDDAGPDALSWLGNEKYAARLATTRAAAILALPGAAVPAALACIRVADPDLALSRILPWFAPAQRDVTPGAHPTAIIEPGAQVAEAAIGPHVFIGHDAQIGAGTQIHAGAYIGESTRIGENCVLWPNVVVRERCRIGDRVVIHPGATIGADGFGYLPREGGHCKIPQVGIVVIEDDVEIGANSCIDRARSGETRIGRGTKIDNLVQIAHNCRIGEHCIVVAQVGLSGSCSLGRHVVLAGQVGVADHVSIGDGTRVGAQSGVNHDVPAGATVLGLPIQDATAMARQWVALKRLPALLEQVRELSKRIERIESSANDKE